MMKDKELIKTQIKNLKEGITWFEQKANEAKDYCDRCGYLEKVATLNFHLTGLLEELNNA